MSRTRLVLSAVAVFGVLTVGACSDDDSSQIEQTSSKEAREESKEKSESEEFSKKDLKEAVKKADLGSDDVGHGVSRGQHQDDLDAPTSDICGEQGESDQNRIERLQDHFWEEGAENPSLVVSNEVVAYEPGTGAGVLEELEEAVAGCDEWEHESGEMTDLRLTEPPKDALGASFAWTGTNIKEGQDYNYMAIYQTNGDLMSAVYIWTKSGTTLSEVSGDVVAEAASKLESAL